MRGVYKLPAPPWHEEATRQRAEGMSPTEIAGQYPGVSAAMIRYHTDEGLRARSSASSKARYARRMEGVAPSGTNL